MLAVRVISISASAEYVTDGEPTQPAPEPEDTDLIRASLFNHLQPDVAQLMPTTESIDEVLCLPALYSRRQRDRDIAAIYREAIHPRIARRVNYHVDYDNMKPRFTAVDRALQ